MSNVVILPVNKAFEKVREAYHKAFEVYSTRPTLARKRVLAGLKKTYDRLIDIRRKEIKLVWVNPEFEDEE